MTGALAIVGLGPGGPLDRTPRAEAALTDAEHLLGYGPYLARLTLRPDQVATASDNRAELERARDAFALAAMGRRVALVSGGDPGVFAMASAALEALEHGPPAWRAIPIEIVPGVSAMLAAASRLGAPLGHDFCAISLSDNLKPWPVVLRRLALAAEAGFAIALYNPISRARPWQLGAAFAHLRDTLAPATPVAFVTAALRDGEERITITTLAAADPDLADMRTLVLVGTEQFRLIERGDFPALLYAPRSFTPPHFTPRSFTPGGAT